MHGTCCFCKTGYRGNGMKANLAYWRSVFRQAEAALDAAATRSAVNAAASQLMLEKAKLQQLESAT
jgi:hypothetical protein